MGSRSDWPLCMGAPLKRSPMKRGKRVNPMSAKKRQQIKDEKAARDAYLEAHPYCEGHAAGAPGVCFGALHVHEVITRARGGSTGDPANFKVLCDSLNTAVSQDVSTMRWALASDFLKHSWDSHD